MTKKAAAAQRFMRARQANDPYIAECFMDEACSAAGIDPLNEYRELLPDDPKWDLVCPAYALTGEEVS